MKSIVRLEKYFKYERKLNNKDMHCYRCDIDEVMRT